MSELVFRAAGLADVPALRALIERGYRGDSAKAGWTHEADLLGGPRTSEAELTGMVADPNEVLLLAEQGGELVGCVRLARQADGSIYLGMLTVDPARQAAGLGRRLLAEAEADAVRRFGADRMEMTVISTRAELIAWYERRGWRRTGQTAPFPTGEGMFGDLPPRDLEFVVLDKRLKA